MTELVCAWYLSYTRHILPFTDRSGTTAAEVITATVVSAAVATVAAAAHIVDLAESEAISKSNPDAALQNETIKINNSILILKQVMTSLKNEDMPTNIRDSIWCDSFKTV